MVKYLKKIMQILFLIVIIVLIGGILYLWHPRFGASATGFRLALMESKPNFANGALTIWNIHLHWLREWDILIF